MPQDHTQKGSPLSDRPIEKPPGREKEQRNPDLTGMGVWKILWDRHAVVKFALLCGKVLMGSVKHKRV